MGARIRELREDVRGYSLRELAAKAHVSRSMLSMIERGERNASEQVIASVARALSVGVSHLRGQPYREQMQKDRLDQMIEPLGAALDNWDLAAPDDAVPPRSLVAIRGDVMKTRAMREKADLVGLAENLPSLMEEILHSLQLGHSDAERAELHWMQTEAARGVWRVAYRVGEMHLARLALARMAQAAARSEDPRQVAIERWMRAQTAFEGGAPGLDIGLRLVTQALSDLGDDGRAETRAVRGALHLKGAILSARRGDLDESDAWLDEARAIAKGTGETSCYELTFGPTNVEFHAVAAAADRDKHSLALKRAKAVRIPDDFPVGRVGHFYLDLARAQVWTAQHESAFDSLLKARQQAPQQTRYHPQTIEVSAAIRRAKARIPDELREFCLWCGV
ncbi:helix-turn-helix transcriptional regulator [Streptomyces sp. B1866]|uniref:helix-turn-helix domain-containing protein n=1 Tax=Streptomyces sp. B1866 TaxID=3075431 RepID=UPI00288DEEE0|nr:helix-turn-helix transcriptional regulator [Streptomyces sp. B1866]MDT3400092.1 helix-turn-helix transcriptional regulator [Streptomyces sp. B1866]